MSTKTTIMSDALLFKRQFLLSQKAITSRPADFKESDFAGYKVYAHQDLDVTFAGDDAHGVNLALFGFILDAEAPRKNNLEILNDIARRADLMHSSAQVFRQYSGRFVLFVSKGDDLYAFNDPCGLRTLYYTRNEDGLCLGSSTEILKLATHIEKGQRHDAYMASAYVAGSMEHWLPSGCSLYENVGGLAPNHFLRLSDLAQVRYWPNGPIGTLDIDEGAKEAARIMENLVLAANERFKLAIPMTAGWDSRLVLALSRKIATTTFMYTLRYRSLRKSSNDIKIPRHLLSSLGLQHKVLNCKSVVPDRDFTTAYETNTVPSHYNDWGKIAYGILKAYPQDRVCLKGNCSEIVRCYYYPKGHHLPVDSYTQIVALEKGWAGIPFIEQRIQAWFDGAADAAQKNNISILDLFYWEQRMGSWQAQSQSEWDIAQETFTPYNHRGLLETMLAVPAGFRKAPDYLLYEKIIQLSWPETLNYPINPPERERGIKPVLAKLGLYEWAKNRRDNVRALLNAFS